MTKFYDVQERVQPPSASIIYLKPFSFSSKHLNFLTVFRFFVNQYFTDIYKCIIH